jgi:hypothetical protein
MLPESNADSTPVMLWCTAMKITVKCSTFFISNNKLQLEWTIYYKWVFVKSEQLDDLEVCLLQA